MNAEEVKKLRDETGAGMLDCKKALEATKGDITAAVDWLREKGISKAADKTNRIAAEGLADIMFNENKAVILEMNCETDFVAKNPEFQELVKQVSTVILENKVSLVEEVLELSYQDQKINDLIIAKTAKIGEKLSLRRFKIIEKESDEKFGSYIHLGGKIAVLTVVKGDDVIAKEVAMHIAAMKPHVISEQDLTPDEIAKEKAILKEQALAEGKPDAIAEKIVIGRLQKYFQEVCLLKQSYVKDPDITVEEFLQKNNTQLISFMRYAVGEGMEKRDENFADEVKNQMKKD